MAQKYVAPVLNDPSRALLALPAGEPALDLLCASFDLDSRQWEYEYALRDALCGMWLRFQKLDARFWHASQTEAEAAAGLNTPMKRSAKPEEVANAIVFLASKEASYITGEEIDINGGSHMD